MYIVGDKKFKSYKLAAQESKKTGQIIKSALAVRKIPQVIKQGAQATA